MKGAFLVGFDDVGDFRGGWIFSGKISQFSMENSLNFLWKILSIFSGKFSQFSLENSLNFLWKILSIFYES
jgi:hypothetical protein